MPNPLQRPNPSQRHNSPQKPTTKSNQKKIITTGGNNNNKGNGNNNTGGGGNNNNNNRQPSPWLLTETPPIDNSASFVEYLRWMREPNYQYKEGTKVQILQLACEKAKNYQNRLSTLNQRTKLIAGENNTFSVKSPWRIRVGGHRGPESILLPAFDALGMPFLPSSSLRGVARNYAIREILKDDSEWNNLQNQLAKIDPNNKNEFELTQKKIDKKWKEAQLKIAPIFGDLDANKADQAGKIVFFDAYPTEGKLAMDIANNIWQWENNNLKYSPNPNPFLSVKEATFLIGIKLASHCHDTQILNKVKQWLIKGLEEGLGSQINTGYGQLITVGRGNINNRNEFLRLELTIKGQLIHGYQAFTQWNWNNNRQEWQMRGKAMPEVRSTAFKSMLRYWFRVFALGVLSVNQVQEWEGKLFGLIQPKRYDGWIKFRIEQNSIIEPTKKQVGEESGTLTLSFVDNAPSNYQNTIKDLFENLLWLMLHLGGIGQGARRSLYQRNKNPYFRGSSLYITSPENWVKLPSKLEDFVEVYQSKIKSFYTALETLTNQKNIANNLHEFIPVTQHQWGDVIDQNCKMLVVRGDADDNKCYSLRILHQQFHQLENEMIQLKKDYKFKESKESKAKYSEMKSLCGGVNDDDIKINGKENKRKATASPIWIRNFGKYQVVTVFGATQNPRQRYLEELRNQADEFVQIFPFQ